MEGLLKFILALIAVMVLATVAFGQTPDAAPAASGWSTFALEEELILPMVQQTEESEPLPVRRAPAAAIADEKPVSIPVNQMKRVDAGEPLQTAPAQQALPVTQEQLQNIQFTDVPIPAEGAAEPLKDQLFEQFMGVEPVEAEPAPQQMVESEGTSIFKSKDVAPGEKALKPTNEAFNPQIWQGITGERAEAILARLRSNRLQSPEGRLLLQRLLLTESKPPEGLTAPSWIAQRAHTLQILGMAESANTLLTGLPANVVVQDKLLSQVWVENALLVGDDQAACSFVRAHILNNNGSFWRKALLVCQALSGNADAFRLSWQLVQDEEKAAEPIFYGLMTAFAGGSGIPELEGDAQIPPLQAMIYAISPRLLSVEVVKRLPDMVLRSLIAREDLELTLRLRAAERLANETGDTTDVDNLAMLYQSIQFDITFGEDPLKLAASAEDGGVARALLWQVAGGAALPSARAVGLHSLWQRAQQDGLGHLPSLLLPDLRGIQATPTLAWFAPFVVRTALRAGEVDMAKEWWQVLQTNKSLTEDIAAQRTDLALAFALLDGKVTKKTVRAWWAQRTFGTQEERVEVQRALAVLESSGMDVPVDVWQELHAKFNDAHGQQGTGPGPLWLRLVANSLEQQHMGEAVLVLMEPLMYVAPAQMAPQGIANIVSGLRYLGLKDEAQVLALEALLPQNGTTF